MNDTVRGAVGDTANEPRAQERKAILDRDKWRCTAIVQPREIRPGFWLPREPRRCSVMGSEMVVVDGDTYCPKHARPLGDSRSGDSARPSLRSSGGRRAIG